VGGVTFVTSLVFRYRAVVACIHCLFGVVYSSYNAHSLIINMYIYYTVGPTAHISYNTVLLHYMISLKTSIAYTLHFHSPSHLPSISSVSTLAPYMHKLYIGLRTYRPITSCAAARRRFPTVRFCPGSALIDSELPNPHADTTCPVFLRFWHW